MESRVILKLDEEYRVTSIPLNIVLEKKTIGKKGDSEGKVVWVNEGYFQTLQGCLNKYLQVQVKSKQAEDIKSLIRSIELAEENIKKTILNNLEKFRSVIDSK